MSAPCVRPPKRLITTITILNNFSQLTEVNQISIMLLCIAISFFKSFYALQMFKMKIILLFLETP